MQNLKLPIGIDDFEKLRQENFYYVDKTPLILELINGWSEVNLFTRPRRFGKTLNMTMLKTFFEIGANPELFKGLAVSENAALCDKYMGKFPVVFISLKGIDALSFEDAYVQLRTIIRNEALRLSYLMDSDQLSINEKQSMSRILEESDQKADIENSLAMFTQLLCKHHAQRTILLIDEYDVPLDKGYQRGYYDEILSLMRNMFNAALKTNSSLYLAVMTGCLRVSKESIFTGLNNLRTYTISDAGFDEYFGFTEEEIQMLLSDYGLEMHHDVIKEWYDGYHFGNQDVYCPWDVLNYCYDLLQDPKADPKSYWRNTSSNTIVRNLIDCAETASVQMDIEELIAGNSIRKMINEQLTYNEIDMTIENIWSVLLMTGYLTLVGKPEKRSYSLMIPNKEINEIFKEQVVAWFQDKTRNDSYALNTLFDAFAMGKTDIIEDILNRILLDTISFHDAYESFYHGFLLALLSVCANWAVVSNSETGKGRSDILVEQKDRKLGFIIEVKHVKTEKDLETSCEAAIQQIEVKDYTAHLRKYRFQNIWVYGIAFFDKECKVLAKQIK